MGSVTKRIIGDNRTDPGYSNITIELNADWMVHIHVKNVRLDLTKVAYNELRRGCLAAEERVRARHGLGGH